MVHCKINHDACRDDQLVQGVDFRSILKKDTEMVNGIGVRVVTRGRKGGLIAVLETKSSLHPLVNFSATHRVTHFNDSYGSKLLNH